MSKNNRTERIQPEERIELPFTEVVANSQPSDGYAPAPRMYTADKLKEMGYTKLRGNKIQIPSGAIFYMRKSEKPLRAIRLFCAECFGMDRRYKKDQMPIDDIRNCSDPMCPLYDFRFGKNPFFKVSMSAEQRKAAGERLRLARESI